MFLFLNYHTKVRKKVKENINNYDFSGTITEQSQLFAIFASGN